MTATLPTESLLVTAGSPDELRALDTLQLDGLAGEIRRYLVASLASTGGHLGSNLGIVELTIAMHRVFDSPTDAIVWDTGHQAYVHKILTGRLGGFACLRQAGGLSGYPNRSESVHDLVENSHASTALSYAYGLAMARRARQAAGRVVAVVGDGALTGGLSYEALNNIGTTGADVIVVLNDNGRSYAPTISRLAAGRRDGAARAASFFRALGLSYAGPVDGHDIEGLEEALVRVSASRGPVVLHVLTTKGRGYAPAEADPEKCLHDVNPFDPETGRALRPVAAQRSYTRAFSAALAQQASLHPEVVAITAAMPGPTGLLDFAERFPDRYFDVGIAEQHAVTAAAGMAMGGLRPVVAVYSTFLNRAWDQVYYDVGLHRLPVVFCLDRAGITGDDGPSHHGVLDMMLLTKVPGMTVLAPSSVEEVGAMLATALSVTSGPVAIRWPKTEARSVPTTGLGLRARKVRSGSDVCLLGVGKLVAACEEAADLLVADGISATVWDLRAPAPLDPAMIRHAIGHRLVVTAEDGVAAGGVGTSVCSAMHEVATSANRPEVVVRGVPTAYVPHGRASDILARLELDGPGLRRAVLKGIAGGQATVTAAKPARGISAASTEGA
ncbi:MAG: 1-deoxy-D-xylulose-5-phosphate synthase [Acidimicrobiales bacterium]